MEAVLSRDLKESVPLYEKEEGVLNLYLVQDVLYFDNIEIVHYTNLVETVLNRNQRLSLT